MGISTVQTYTCDCCGYVITGGATWIGILMNGISYVFCNTYGCSAGITNVLTSDINTKSVAHKATTVAGVILAH